MPTEVLMNSRKRSKEADGRGTFGWPLDQREHIWVSPRLLGGKIRSRRMTLNCYPRSGRTGSWILTAYLTDAV